MANFDPKTKIERLLLKHPSLSRLFADAAPAVDDQLTVEEFCFVNGIDFMEFFKRLDAAVAEADERDRTEREAVESRIAVGAETVRDKVAADSPATPTAVADEGRHDPIVLGLLALGIVFFALSAIGNFFSGAQLVRTILGIRPTDVFPHVPQMLSFLNIVSAGGCVILLLWRKLGIVLLLFGAMIYDVLAVALTDSLPTDTILAAVITLSLIKIGCNGKKYKDLLK